MRHVLQLLRVHYELHECILKFVLYCTSVYSIENPEMNLTGSFTRYMQYNTDLPERVIDIDSKFETRSFRCSQYY